MKPCKTCPWRRESPRLTVEKTGDPTRFIGQAHGAFWLPCHNSKGYDENRRDPNHRQCVGAAMFRDLVGVADRLPAQLAKHKGDPSVVFATPAEFFAHHARIEVWEAEAFLDRYPPALLLAAEMMRQGVAQQEVK